MGRILLQPQVDLSHFWEYTDWVADRYFRRRELGPLVLGATAFFAGAFADGDHHHDLASQDRYQRFVTEQAARCADQCGDLKLPYSLGFDTSTRPYGLVIPELAKSGYPNVPDGRYVQFVPMWANGEPEPPKPEPPKILTRPEWSKEILAVPIFKGPSDKPRVALTIDDGGEALEEILETILRKKAKATFLIIGRIVAGNPGFAKRATETGRVTWANHTLDHLLNFANATESQISGQMVATENIIKQATGLSTRPFGRPPGGTRSTNGINAFVSLGYATMLWNVSGDAGEQWTSSNPQALANYYLGLIDSQKNPWGSIVLMHFRKSTGISTRPGVPSALELFIDGVRARGMEPGTIDELYEPKAA